MRLFTIGVGLLTSVTCFSQTITPQVINSAGGHRPIGSTGLYITDNVGEPFVMTHNAQNIMITEGFLQPENITIKGFTAVPVINHMVCMDKESDASISILLTSAYSAYTAQYLWSPSNFCPGTNCASIYSLTAGTYSVKILIDYRNSLGTLQKDSLTLDSMEVRNATVPCFVKPFSGISALSQKNKVFYIENIKEFPEARVTIYNRWGQEMFDIKGYDYDVPDKSWPRVSELSSLPATTYFYIIDLNNGSKPLKGWVELLKN